VRLEVRSASDSETYLDIARIPREYRKNRRGQLIDRGEICEVFCEDTGKRWFVVMHGAPAKMGATIRIDDHVRKKLGVQSRQAYEFNLRQADGCGQIWWALHATDIRFRFPAIISIISVALGVLLGLVGILISVLR
jgi:hypothetical protein